MNVLRGGCQGIYRLRPRSFATRRLSLCIHLWIKCSYMKAEDFKVRLKVSTLSIYTLSTLLFGNNSFRINHPFMLYQSFPLPEKSPG